MKLPIHWLKEYISVKDSPEKLGEKLTLAGLEVGKIEKVGNNAVLDLEVTPNRADCLSMLGLAREVAAITGQKLPSAPATKFKSLREMRKTHPLESNRISLNIKDKEVCPRMIAALFEGVVIRPSPSIIQERLISYGMKPINNVVDITNYIMVELGQPLHAFDADKLTTQNSQLTTIYVRKAKEGEKILTLDGKERELGLQTLVLADRNGPIDIAGIQGGAHTAISPETSSIILSVSQFHPSLIRRASKTFHFQTESSYRFERGLDPLAAEEAFLRAVDLLRTYCSANLSALDSIDTEPWKPTILHGAASRLRDLIGLSETILPDIRLARILKQWGFEVRVSKKKWTIVVPSFRRDITMWEDLVEEVARMLDYNELPKTVIRGEIRAPASSPLISGKEKLRDAVAKAGFDEILTYSFYGEQDIRAFSLSEKTHLSLLNPISPDQMYLRGSLVPSLLRAASGNLRHIPDVKLFELGTIFSSTGDGLPKEESRLAALAAGKKPLEYILGALHFILHAFGINDAQVQMKPEIIEEGVQGSEADIVIDETTIGTVGIPSAAILQKFKIKNAVAVLSLFPAALSQLKKSRLYTAISPYPEIERDLSIVVGQKFSFRELKQAIETQSNLPLAVELFDTFIDEKRFPKGTWSMAFHLTFQHPSRTLTSQEVELILGKVRKELTDKFGAQIR